MLTDVSSLLPNDCHFSYKLSKHIYRIQGLKIEFWLARLLTKLIFYAVVLPLKVEMIYTLRRKIAISDGRQFLKTRAA
jgi:hypothetical protein